MSGDDRSLGACLMRSATSLAEPIYSTVVRRRNRRFDRGVGVERAHVPVISIGNLTTGGTGKTPMTIFVLERLIAMGRTPAVLTRGYKADERGRSDEATLISERLADVPVIVDADRVGGAATAKQQHPHGDVLVLDDGFQHRRLARDVDLVLIDATCPFGYGRPLPRGMLREPVESLRRADGVIVTHVERIGAEALKHLDQRIADAHGKPPVAHFEHGWRCISDADGEAVDAAGRRTVAFCGIGNPGAFFDQAAKRSALVGSRAFADHHGYTPADLAGLRKLAAEQQAHALLTTEKDWVKLRAIASACDGLPIWHSVLELRPREGEDVLDSLLRQAVAADADRF